MAPTTHLASPSHTRSTYCASNPQCRDIVRRDVRQVCADATEEAHDPAADDVSGPPPFAGGFVERLELGPHPGKLDLTDRLGQPRGFDPLACESIALFRPNKAVYVESAITIIAVGECVVSFLDRTGVPSPVERVWVILFAPMETTPSTPTREQVS